ncbi:MAG: translation initiation factor IF-2 [Myxococcota bacterium]
MRAYKLAEEFGIERDELLIKAAELGIELRSPMVSLDDEQIATLREKLGSGPNVETVERRVGTTVIRRRRKKVAEPAPAAPEPAEDLPTSEPFPELEEPAAVEASEPAPIPEPTAPPGPADGIPRHLDRPAMIVEDPLAAHPQPAPAAPVAAQAGADAESAPIAEAPPLPVEGRRAPSSPEQQKGIQRRQVLEGQTLREQDTIARQARGNVQAHLERRRMLVDQQSRIQSVRRPKPKSRLKVSLPTAPPKSKVVRMGSSISFYDFSKQTGLKIRELLRRVSALDPEIERADLIDLATATLLAEELEYEIQHVETETEKAVAAASAPRAEAGSFEPRSPVVTVMGHVDHGKTSLLDTIRQANVVSGEAGGITQHIGAYQTELAGNLITFIDTPGHAAFTQMRARGAQVTDIVILVVAADDGVMPQTVEAINHAKAAGVPIVVAVNKIDKPEANPQRVKQALLEHEIVAEEFGGETICVEVSAIKGEGIEKLLEMVALQAELLELKASRKGKARGVVIEAQLDRGRGPLATVLVQEGTLRRGDAVVVGNVYGRIRTLEDDQRKAVKEAIPAMPVRLIGLSGVPESGDELVVVDNEREAKRIVEHRLDQEKRSIVAASEVASLSAEDVFAQLEDSDEKELLVVVKADVRGTMEAICEAMENLSTDRVTLRVLHNGIGGITESDVMLASASHAVILGFHVRAEPAARKLAESEGTELRVFDVVYDVLDDATKLMQGLLPPMEIERVAGRAEVRQLFVVPRVGTIAGCAVTDGLIRRGIRARVLRDAVPVYTGSLASLKHFKDDVREVRSPLECGLRLENFNDVKVGDVIESFEIEEIADTL